MHFTFYIHICRTFQLKDWRHTRHFSSCLVHFRYYLLRWDSHRKMWILILQFYEGQWVKVTHFPKYLEKVSPLAAVVVFHHDHDDSFNILQPKVATIYHWVETQSQYTRSCQCWCFWRLLFLEWNLSTLWDGWGNFRRNAEYGETSIKAGIRRDGHLLFEVEIYLQKGCIMVSGVCSS